eukprot:jgi/Chrpa1/12251/Chrysochromulina_OHIO_Genome00019768-RA
MHACSARRVRRWARRWTRRCCSRPSTPGSSALQAEGSAR